MILAIRYRIVFKEGCRNIFVNELFINFLVIIGGVMLIKVLYKNIDSWIEEMLSIRLIRL